VSAVIVWTVSAQCIAALNATQHERSAAPQSALYDRATLGCVEVESLILEGDSGLSTIAQRSPLSSFVNAFKSPTQQHIIRNPSVFTKLTAEIGNFCTTIEEEFDYTGNRWGASSREIKQDTHENAANDARYGAFISQNAAYSDQSGSSREAGPFTVGKVDRPCIHGADAVLAESCQVTTNTATTSVSRLRTTSVTALMASDRFGLVFMVTTSISLGAIAGAL
jgi:hypothetical protein